MSLPDDLKILKRQHHIPLGWKVAAWLMLCMGVVGHIDMKVEEAAAEVAQEAPRRESIALTHPLSCSGRWTKTCADFQPCKTTCNPEEQ